LLGFQKNEQLIYSFSLVTCSVYQRPFHHDNAFVLEPCVTIQCKITRLLMTVWQGNLHGMNRMTVELAVIICDKKRVQ